MTRDLFSAPTPSARDVLSVGQLNHKARQLLETHLSLTWVEGEMSNVATPSSGHWYFTLKDADAQIRCAMFRNRNSLVRFKPEQGKQVVIRGRVSLYEGRGEYQLIAEHIEEAGFGVLQRAFDALKAKLNKEGLFDEKHKQAIPELPKHIGIVTSPTGAAIRDILHVLKRRFAGIPVTIIPVAVQGDGSAKQIVQAIETANEIKKFDVLLLSRGGGSLEDLWPFNEEIVARAIFASKLPIVSAVGHEVDFTISDFVADLRAPTPSAAAELLSPDGDDWLETFAGYEILLSQSIKRLLAHARQLNSGLAARLRHPGERLQSRAQHLDTLEIRLRRAMNFQFHDANTTFNSLLKRYRRCVPSAQINRSKKNLVQLNQNLMSTLRHLMKFQQQKFSSVVEALDTVSPLNTIQRGYSILVNEQGEIIRDASSLNKGQRIKAKLAKGQVVAKVEAIEAEQTDLHSLLDAK
ncbi:exodeoxyribonuclease VII large subunit [Aurantivibrio infirmus]